MELPVLFCLVVWNLFKKRHEGDLRRLSTAYRFFLKTSLQEKSYEPTTMGPEGLHWKGGFGKAVNQLFRNWPTPNESKLFEKLMRRWLKKGKTTDHAFIMAFNDFLEQKRLRFQELQEVIDEGKRNFGGE